MRILRSVVFCLTLIGCSHATSTMPPLTPNGAAPAAAGTQRSASAAAYDPAAVTLKPLYSFSGTPDGANPAGLLQVNGTFYGTTTYGGASGSGTVFSLSASGTERILYSFTGGADGGAPRAGLTELNGELYGTTNIGGASGAGTVFKVNTPGTEHVLYSFKGGTQGEGPSSNLIVLNGKLYGTTDGAAGGQSYGTVFELSTSGSERLLYAFVKNGRDGKYPSGDLIAVNGVLYGITADGGTHNDGSVFELTTAGAERVIYSFRGGADGVYPTGGLVNVNGELYGVTFQGGVTKDCAGCGTIFAVSTSGAERVLHRFGSGHDSATPEARLVALKGALYGTTSGGGSTGCGTVFQTSTSGTEHVLYSFNCRQQGPLGLLEANGALYGGFYYGGAANEGMIFALSL